MYQIIFLDQEDKILMIDKVDEVKIHENEKDMSTITDGITTERIGLKFFLIFPVDINFTTGEILNQEQKDKSLNKLDFIIITEPKSLTAMQEYIRSLEQKLEASN